MPVLVIPKSFKKRLLKKPAAVQGAIMKCIKKLDETPELPGLHVKPVQGAPGVFEAYVDNANRVSFTRGPDGSIHMVNHCNHDLVRRTT